MKKLTVFQQKLIAAGSLVAVSIGSASAAVPAAVSTALGDAATDAVTVGGLAMVAVVAAVAFKYLRRAL